MDDAVLDGYERRLGVVFPQELRAVWTSCHGGYPVERNEFWFRHPSLGYMGSGIGALVTLAPDDDVDGLMRSVRVLHEHRGMPRELIPFAMDGGGDYICLDYRGDTGAPRVVYWSHEVPEDESIAFLASSFSEFLEILVPPEPLPSDEDEPV